MVINKIKKNIADRPRKIIEDKSRIPAAVLILLYEKAGEVYLLFTRRTEKVADHKGEISFPGGARDHENESCEATALREAAEEIGIIPETIEVLGLLDDCLTVSSNYVITPVVGTTPTTPQFQISPDEVEEVIEIPLSFFQDVFKQRTPPADEFIPQALTFQYREHFIWGVTACIMKQLLSLLAFID
jgi:8-oxo-dGTP pyrophosphatase MutT (NUDIX family)